MEREQLVEIGNDDSQWGNVYFLPDGELSAKEFRKQAALVRRDFVGTAREQFNRLDEAISRLDPKTLKGSPENKTRDILANAIRAMLRFVQAAE